MLSTINIGSILFLDIETAPRWENFENMPENFRKLWEHKVSFFQNTPSQTAEEIYDRAGIYAEFGKIICISVGNVHQGILKIKSFYGDDEKAVLLEFADLLNKYFNKDYHSLCAHNGKEFDYPYIARRMVVHGIELPSLLDTSGKKPWEIKLLDTMELWKFGDYKSYTSLALLSALFDIPTSKDDIDGSDVARVYWREKNLNRIVTYCQKDVISIVQLFLKYQNKSLIESDKIKIAD
jgi:DNA polymerase elongation subunit (family B)